MRFNSVKLNSWAVPSYQVARNMTLARDQRSMCCTWFANDCAWATWTCVLETFLGAVRRLSKISNSAFECDYDDDDDVAILKNTVSELHFLLYKNQHSHLIQSAENNIHSLTLSSPTLEVPLWLLKQPWMQDRGSLTTLVVFWILLPTRDRRDKHVGDWERGGWMTSACSLSKN